MSRAARKHLIADTLAAFVAAGCPVKGARLCVNGDLLLLTEAPDTALPSNDDGDWVDLAGQTETPRAKRT
jgi:hypothetical protein